LLIERVELPLQQQQPQQPQPPHLTLLGSVAQRLSQQRPGEFAERLAHILTETVQAPTPELLPDLSEALTLPFAVQLDLSLTLAQYSVGAWQEEGALRSLPPQRQSNRSKRGVNFIIVVKPPPPFFHLIMNARLIFAYKRRLCSRLHFR
jgi:hypothetical protein